MVTGVSGPARQADIVFVGAGPQTLRALADLEVALAARGAPEPVRVLAFDPSAPGAGTVWDVAQPSHLLMNVSASLVDLRCPSVPHALEAWHRETFGSECAEYPPRALVGEYLRWAWVKLEASPYLRLEHAAEMVSRVAPEPHGARGMWRCEGASTSALAPRVVLCTGHRAGTVLDHEGIMSGRCGAEAGQEAVVRGAALSAIDTVLSLTEGRGGTWSDDGYIASGLEPDRITLVSRSGQFMLPKPEHPRARAVAAAAVEPLLEHWGAAEPLSEAWWEVLVQSARAVARAHGIEVAAETLARCLDTPPHMPDAAARLRDDLSRAAGDLDDDPAWWLGRAWAASYTAITDSLERAPRQPDTWRVFCERRTSLERWAFGPPGIVARRLGALMRCGLLRVVCGDADTIAAEAGTAALRAHLPGPGIMSEPWPWPDDPGSQDPIPDSPVWQLLLREGHVSVRPGEPGVFTTSRAECVGSHGERSAGLYALGRPTEGPVIDHDSLQRTLHLDARRWAEHTAKELTRP